MRIFSGRGVAARLLVAGAVMISVVGACADKKGALMLAINTDMKAPQDVNAVSVTISTNGAIKDSFIGRVTPQGDVLLPATLAIVEPEDKSASIRIRVMAFQDRKARVMRDVRTTVPSGGRVALLRIPLNFVNDGSAAGDLVPVGLIPDPHPGTGGTPDASSGSGTDFSGGAAAFDFFGAFQPPCPDIENQTIIDGECNDNFVDPAKLPDFEQGALGDSTDPGSCFDVGKCFAQAIGVGESNIGSSRDAGVEDAAPPTKDGGVDGADAGPPNASAVTLDRSTCVLQLNGANPARLNLAIVTPDTGECVRPGECYIPIDRGPSGWQDQNGSVQLPKFVCTLLSKKSLHLATSTDTCAAKAESNPICMAKPPVAAPVGGDCASFASIYCAKLQECQYFGLFNAYVGQDDCAAYLASYCDAAHKAPGSTQLTAECNASIATASCDSFLGAYGFIQSCFEQGTLPDGAKCQYGTQCLSGECATLGADDCGTCRARLPSGADCSGSAIGSCDFGLACLMSSADGGAEQCVAPIFAGLNEACGVDARICTGHLQCLSGKCTAPLPAGAACGLAGSAGECDYEGGYTCVNGGMPNGTCQRVTYASTAGAACGGSLGVQCARDFYCDATAAQPTCVPRPTVGQPCMMQANDCAGTASCVNGVCAALDPFRCNPQ